MLNVLLLVTEIELMLLDLFSERKQKMHCFLPFMDKYIFHFNNFQQKTIEIVRCEYPLAYATFKV